MEALAFCSFLILILVIGGLVSLYETITSSRRTNQNAQISVQISNDQVSEVIDRAISLVEIETIIWIYHNSSCMGTCFASSSVRQLAANHIFN